MATCDRMKEHLVGLLYDDISAEDRRRAEEHLAGCGPCRDELEALGDLRALLAEHGGVPETPAGRITVLPARTPRAPLWAAAAALLVAVGITGFSLGRASVEDRILDRVSQRQALWEGEQKESLRTLQLESEKLRRIADRTQNLVEYTLLASEAPRLVEY